MFRLAACRGLPPLKRGSFFERRVCFQILSMMARPGRELAIAHVPQHPAECRSTHRDPIFLMEPADQVAQSPTNNAIQIGNWTIFDNAGQRRHLFGIQTPGFGPFNEGRQAGTASSFSFFDLRWPNAFGGGAAWGCQFADDPGLGVAVQRPWSGRVGGRQIDGGTTTLERRAADRPGPGR